MPIDGEDGELGQDDDDEHPLVVRKTRSRQGPCAGGARRGTVAWRCGHQSPCASARVLERHVGGDRQQDDQPLDRLLPLRLDAEEHQRRADRAEQGDADQRADQRAAPAGDRRAADDDGGDRPAAPGPSPALGRTAVKRTAFSSAARPASAPISDERRRRRRAAAGCRPAARPRRPTRRRRPPGPPPGSAAPRRRPRSTRQRESRRSATAPAACAEPEPLEAGRQVPDALALA